MTQGETPTIRILFLEVEFLLVSNCLCGPPNPEENPPQVVTPLPRRVLVVGGIEDQEGDGHQVNRESLQTQSVYQYVCVCVCEEG